MNLYYFVHRSALATRKPTSHVQQHAIPHQVQEKRHTYAQSRHDPLPHDRPRRMCARLVQSIDAHSSERDRAYDAARKTILVVLRELDLSVGSRTRLRGRRGGHWRCWWWWLEAGRAHGRVTGDDARPRSRLSALLLAVPMTSSDTRQTRPRPHQRLNADAHSCANLVTWLSPPCSSATLLVLCSTAGASSALVPERTRRQVGSASESSK